MTIKDAIQITDDLRPNQYTYDDKLVWLSALDGQIYREVILTHEGAEEISFTEPYTDLGVELLIPEPYAMDVYVPYLQARIDRENGETAKWNQSISLYNSGYTTFMNWYNRTHKPLSRGNFRF